MNARLASVKPGALRQTRYPTGFAVLAATVLLCLAGPVQGITVDLQDLNSTARFDLDDVVRNGLVSWQVDGVEQVYQQWFYYRIGDTGPEQNVSSLGLTGYKVTDVNEYTGNDTLSLWFTVDGNFKINLTFSLTGGGAGSYKADMQETVKVTNLSSSSKDFHIFQYCDFDLGGTPNDDVVSVIGGNSAYQVDTHFITSETVVNHLPTHYEAGAFDTTLQKLLDQGPTTLNDQANAGPGDVTWAFQWDFTLGTGLENTYIISKDKNFGHMPEPLTVLGTCIGLGSLGAYLRRRRLA